MHFDVAQHISKDPPHKGNENGLHVIMMFIIAFCRWTTYGSMSQEESIEKNNLRDEAALRFIELSSLLITAFLHLVISYFKRGNAQYSVL